MQNIKQSNKILNTVTGDCGDNCGGVIAQVRRLAASQRLADQLQPNISINAKTLKAA